MKNRDYTVNSATELTGTCQDIFVFAGACSRRNPCVRRVVCSKCVAHMGIQVTVLQLYPIRLETLLRQTIASGLRPLANVLPIAVCHLFVDSGWNRRVADTLRVQQQLIKRSSAWSNNTIEASPSWAAATLPAYTSPRTQIDVTTFRCRVPIYSVMTRASYTIAAARCSHRKITSFPWFVLFEMLSWIFTS